MRQSKGFPHCPKAMVEPTTFLRIYILRVLTCASKQPSRHFLILPTGWENGTGTIPIHNGCGHSTTEVQDETSTAKLMLVLNTVGYKSVLMNDSKTSSEKTCLNIKIIKHSERLKDQRIQLIHQILLIATFLKLNGPWYDLIRSVQ